MPSRLPDWLTRSHRTPKILIAAVALTGLGITGAAAASAAGASTHPATNLASHVRTASDPDNIQSGDQTSPDTPGSSDGEQSGGPDTDNIQSGDQTSPDRASSVQTAAQKTTGHKAVTVHLAATQKSTSAAAGQQKAGAADTDNVQSGDQTGPDTPGSGEGESSSGPDTDNIQSGSQSGDQSGPETPDSGGNR
jgi:hypothetical protein